MAKLTKYDANLLLDHAKTRCTLIQLAHKKLDRGYLLMVIRWALEDLEKWRTEVAASYKLKRIIEAMKMYDYLVAMKKIIKERAA